VAVHSRHAPLAGDVSSGGRETDLGIWLIGYNAIRTVREDRRVHSHGSKEQPVAGCARRERKFRAGAALAWLTFA